MNATNIHNNYYYDAYLDQLYSSLNEHNSTKVDRAAEAVKSGVGLFYKQLPEILASPSWRALGYLIAYDGISNSLNTKTLSPSTKESIRSALDALKPGMNQLAFKHPAIPERQLLENPKIFYSNPDFAEEKLSKLRREDFLFLMAENLELYRREKNLPTLFFKLHKYFRVLEKSKLMQLGVLLRAEDERKEFAKTYGIEIDELEANRKLLLKNVEGEDQRIDRGVCFAYALFMVAQKTADPALINWQRVRYLQSVYQLEKALQKLLKYGSIDKSAILPPSILKTMNLSPHIEVRENQTLNQMADTWKEGKFIILLNGILQPLGHAIFLSLTDNIFCDCNDIDLITRQPLIRKAANLKDLFAKLQRHIELMYPELDHFDLLKFESTE